jgi:hypothetical protein
MSNPSLPPPSHPSLPPNPSSPPQDAEVEILRQIRTSFTFMLKMLTSLRADMTLLGGRFDRLLEMSEKARRAVKEVRGEVGRRLERVSWD